MQQKSLLLALSILFLLLAPKAASAVVAASPSPKASATATPLASPTDNQATESLKARLRETLSKVEDNGTPSAGTQSDYKAYIGTIKDVIQKTLIVQTKDGKKQITVDDTTTLLRSPGNLPIKLDSVRLDDNLIAIGLPKDAGVLLGTRLIVSATPLSPVIKSTGYGQITLIKGNSLTLTSSGQDITLTLSKDTVIKNKEKSILDATSLSTNTHLIYAAEQDGDKQMATVLMIIQ